MIERRAARTPGWIRIGARGFTLIEVLVVIAIISVIVSIVLPTMAKTREGARQTVAVSNVRSTGVIFSQYAENYKAYPFAHKGVPVKNGGADDDHVPADPDLIAMPWWPEGSIIATTDHFSQAWLWPGIVAAFAPWQDHYATWVSPGRKKDLPQAQEYLGNIEETVSLRYSNSYIASPRLWKREGASTDESSLKAVRPADVTNPARKVMLWDADLAYLIKEPTRVGVHYAAMTPMVFGDLHAGVNDPTKARAPVRNPLGEHDEPMTLHDTEDGVAGMDY